MSVLQTGRLWRLENNWDFYDRDTEKVWNFLHTFPSNVSDLVKN